MIRIAVCDDCPGQIDIILNLLEKYQAERPGLEIYVKDFITGAEVLDSLESGREFDLFLLDIMMPVQNGIELARRIRFANDDVHVVFLTSSTDYALEAFNVQATQYILKPVTEDSLFPVLDKIVIALQRETDSFLFVVTSARDVKIPFSSIVYVESMQRELQFHLADGSKLNSKTIRTPFEQAAAPLLRDSRFLHAHKSYILNMAFVEELTGRSFVMKNGVEIHIPKYRYAEAKNRYLEYLSAQGIGRLGGMR